MGRSTAPRHHAEAPPATATPAATATAAVTVALVAFLLLSWAGCSGPPTPEPDAPAAGAVVVVEVVPGWAADRAGLQPGDRIVGWERRRAEPTGPERGGPGEVEPGRDESMGVDPGDVDPGNVDPGKEEPGSEAPGKGDPGVGEPGHAEPQTAGAVSSPFDLHLLEREEAPRGGFHLRIRRDGRERTVALPAGSWNLTVRPELPGEEEVALFAAARRAEERGEGTAPAGTATDGGAAAGGENGDGGGEGGDAPTLLHRLADRLAAAGRPADAAWFRTRAGALLATAGRWDEARAAFAAAAAAAAAVEDRPEILVAMRELEGLALSHRSHADAARSALEAALAAHRGARRPLAEAEVLSELARLDAFRGRLDDARRRVERSLELRRRHAPGSPAEAQALNARGVVAAMEGDPVASGADFQAALNLLRRAAPGSPELALAENNLGLTARRRGDLRAAQEHLASARAILEAADPDGERLAEVLNNLGIVARHRGRLDEAEAHWRRALEIRRRRAPDSLELARSLGNLGNLAYYQGHLERAEAIARETLALVAAVAPGSMQHLKNLHTLGNVVRDRGDLEEAAALYAEARERAAHQDPGSNVAATLTLALADLALRRGDPDAAAALADEAVERIRSIAPESLDEAAAIALRAGVDEARGDRAAAEGRHRRALELRSGLAPGSAAVVDSLAALGHLARQRGHRGEALDLYRRALEALETQRTHLGGSEEVRSRFSERYAPLYRAVMELLLDEAEDGAGHGGAVDEAFHVLERFRSRSLRALLQERELDLEPAAGAARTAGDAPEESREEGREELWRRLRREHEAARAELARLEAAGAAADAGETARARRRLEDLQVEREALRRAEERSTLAVPPALDAASVARRLPAGTVLLSYAVGESSTLLFVVESAAGEGRSGEGGGTAPGAPAEPGPGASPVRGRWVTAHRIAAGRESLDAAVATFRRLLQDPSPTAASRAALAAAGGHLAGELLRPAAGALARAEDLLVIPDRPLHALPFAALPYAPPDGGTGTERPGIPSYLVEHRSVHTAASASVWDQLRRRHRGSASPALLALGDPERRTGAGGDPARPPGSDRRGGALPPLPFSRQEVRAVARRFGDDARTFVGPAATEERLKGGLDARYLHLACHASADERFPLDSFLALATPAAGDGDGLLRAWEVMEEVRLEGTELVTLSACDSALGAEIGGEGMVGLAHAFHYAGARTVLASLWPVSDRSTAALMDRFYHHLAAGRPAPAALRAAQRELIAAPVATPVAAAEPGPLARWLPFLRPAPTPVDARPPYHWAAFQLHGGS